MSQVRYTGLASMFVGLRCVHMTLPKSSSDGSLVHWDALSFQINLLLRLRTWGPFKFLYLVETYDQLSCFRLHHENFDVTLVILLIWQKYNLKAQNGQFSCL